MASNFTAYNAFEAGKKGTGSSTRSTGDRLFSFGTVIKQRLANDIIVGNVTKYSHTTSKHQSQAHVHSADIWVKAVPRGETDLTKYMVDHT